MVVRYVWWLLVLPLTANLPQCSVVGVVGPVVTLSRRRYNPYAPSALTPFYRTPFACRRALRLTTGGTVTYAWWMPCLTPACCLPATPLFPRLPAFAPAANVIVVVDVLTVLLPPRAAPPAFAGRGWVPLAAARLAAFPAPLPLPFTPLHRACTRCRWAVLFPLPPTFPCLYTLPTVCVDYPFLILPLVTGACLPFLAVLIPLVGVGRWLPYADARAFATAPSWHNYPTLHALLPLPAAIYLLLLPNLYLSLPCLYYCVPSCNPS